MYRLTITTPLLYIIIVSLVHIQMGSPEQVMTTREAEEVSAAYKKGRQDAENQLRHQLVRQKEIWAREQLEREVCVQIIILELLLSSQCDGALLLLSSISSHRLVPLGY